MSQRERPSWASPSTDPSHRIVSCPTCGDAMSWGRFLEHGPTCEYPARDRPGRQQREHLEGGRP